MPTLIQTEMPGFEPLPEPQEIDLIDEEYELLRQADAKLRRPTDDDDLPFLDDLGDD